MASERLKTTEPSSSGSDEIRDLTKIRKPGEKLQGGRRHYSNLRDQRESETWRVAAMINPRERLKAIMRSMSGDEVLSNGRLFRAAA